jgi:hypothetical protein
MTMNGIVLLMSMTAIGVDYGWQIGADGQVEYIVQIEPSLVESLKNGKEIASEIRPEVGNVRRFRIRVGTGALPQGQRVGSGNATNSWGSVAANSQSDSTATRADASNPAAARSASPPNTRSAPLLNLPPPPRDLDSDGTSSVLIRDRSSDLAARRREEPAARASTGSLLNLPPPPTDDVAENRTGWDPNGGIAQQNSTASSLVQESNPRKSATNPPEQTTPSGDSQLSFDRERTTLSDDTGSPNRSVEIWQPTPPRDPAERPSPIGRPSNDDSMLTPIRDPDRAESKPSGPSLQSPGVSNKTAQGDSGTDERLALDMQDSPVVSEPPPEDIDGAQENASDAKPAEEDLAALHKPTLDEETRQLLAEQEAEKPWTPLVVTSLALFASLALNLYLGWVAMGIYRKYRGLALRLHHAQLA